MNNVNFNIPLALAINKKDLRAKLVILGEMTVAYAQPRTPKDLGQARGSIIWAMSDENGNVSHPAADQSEDTISRPTDDLTVRVGSAVNHFKYLEFGTKNMRRSAPLRVSLLSTSKNVKAVMNR